MDYSCQAQRLTEIFKSNTQILQKQKQMNNNNKKHTQPAIKRKRKRRKNMSDIILLKHKPTNYESFAIYEALVSEEV